MTHEAGQLMIISRLFEISETVAFLSILFFVIQYTLYGRAGADGERAFGKWWKNPIGKTIIAKDVVLLAVLAPSLLHFLFGLTVVNSVAFAWYTLASFTMVPVVMIWRSVVFERIRRMYNEVRRQDEQGS